MSYLLVVICFAITIAIHELGHLLAASFFSIPVQEYSVGFWKRIAKVRFRGIDYNLRLIPLGGYVVINPEDIDQAPYYQKIAVLIGGIVANFLLALITLFAVFAFYFAPNDFAQFLLLIKTAAAFCFNITSSTVHALTHIQDLFSNLSSPVGIVQQGGSAIDHGSLTINGQAIKNHQVFTTGYIMSVINISVAIFNLLPVPGLDGGQIALQTWSAITGKTVDKKVANLVNLTGLSFVAAISLVSLIKDLLSLVLK